MAASQSGAAANSICYRAESQRYLGTATSVFKVELLKGSLSNNQQGPPELSVKRNIFRGKL